MEYPKPSVTADIVVIRNGQNRRELLFIHRGNEPFKGMLALPGGFVDPNETVEAAAQRELREETGINVPIWKLRLVGVFSEPGRDPRGWTISTAFVTKGEYEVTAGDDAVGYSWVPFSRLDECDLAFDHARIAAKAGEVARY